MRFTASWRRLRDLVHRSAAFPARHSTVGLLVAVAIVLPWRTVAPSDSLSPFAQAVQIEPTVLRITAPSDGATVGDGNLVLVEIEVTGGAPERVELAFGPDDIWVGASRATAAGHWAYLWSDPAAGSQRIRARALRGDGYPSGAHSVTVKVEEQSARPYVIDNPYAGAGSYHRGQLHVHSTNSFDGWRSMAPAPLAQEYRKRGYRFLVMSDHDVVSYPREVEDAGFLVVPGFESTSDGGHITAAFTEEVFSSALPAQERINRVRAAGGLAFLNHPSWQVGWSATDISSLRSYQAIEIFNGMTADPPARVERNVQLWHQALNVRGWQDRVWAVAVDDSHQMSDIDKAWIAVKLPRLTTVALRRGLEQGAFYASNGPTFSALGVLAGGVFAVSPEATTIRFIDQDLKIVGEGPATGTRYELKGTERWVRVEARTADGYTAWSQPFWVLPNAPRLELVTQGNGRALVGTALPGARVHISDNGTYLGNVTASADGRFAFRLLDTPDGRHEFWAMVIAPGPDQLQSAPAVVSYLLSGATAREIISGS